MDFRDLEAYVQVARSESFSRAATQLRIAQSALSRRVDRLEFQLGTKLFARHGRGVRLTEAGMVLLGRAEALIRDLEAVEADVQCLAKEPTGHVRVALPPATSEVLSPLLVAACRERFPGITLHLREGFSGVVHRWLLDDEVDLAALYSPEHAPELEVAPLLDEPLFLVLPAGMAVKDPSAFPAEDLAGVPLILPQRPSSLRLLVERYAADHGAQARVAYEVDGIRTTRALVEAGLGCTVFSHAEIAGGVKAGVLQAIPLAPRLTWQLCIVSKQRARPSRAAAEIRRLLHANASTLLERGLWRGTLLTGVRP